MKSILLAAATVLLTPSAWAHKSVCISQTGQPQLTVVLESEKELRYPSDGFRYAYSIAVYKQGATYPQVEALGVAEVEDVSFSFASDDKKIRFQMYLDEFDQSTLMIEGSSDVSMTCY